MNWTPQHGAPSERGLTIAEVIVALTLIGLITLFSVRGVLTGMQAYQRGAAAQTVLSEIRQAQALAIERQSIVAFQWGGGALGQTPGSYRIVRDTTGACGLPAAGNPEDGTDVIQGWSDLRESYDAVAIESIEDSGGSPLDEIMFDHIGGSIHTCNTVTFPLTLTLSNSSGPSRTITISSTGGTRLD